MNLKNKTLYVVDIRSRQKKIKLIENDVQNIEILALTPYSTYLLDILNYKYDTFHKIISLKEFHRLRWKEYYKLEKLFLKAKNYSFLIRELAFILGYKVYIQLLFEYFEVKKKDGFKIIYITDVNFSKSNFTFNISNINEVIHIKTKNKLFSRVNNIIFILKYNFYQKNIKNKFLNILPTKLELNYDNENYRNIFESFNVINIKKDKVIYKEFSSFIEKIEKIFIKNESIEFTLKQLQEVLIKIKEDLLIKNTNLNVKLHPFTILYNNKNYLDILLYTKNKIPKIFMQHGSYLVETVFLKHGEIYPADINFVFNDYTKKLFERNGAKKVYSVGSVNFNYLIHNKKEKYDFLYIVYCTNYTYPGVFISTESSLQSVDGTDIYMRHKSIIELFGTQFRDKKICIKIQPGIFVGSMLYVPFFELSKKFKNITIEFTVPISKLIEKSTYIISDYFSSEFINREVHYKRDIILFKGLPFLLPKDVLDDMEKMFILVDTVNDLEEKVKNIEEITKNRKRYDDIIEYYSSKKCDTKKVVNDILKKELNARR